MSHIYDSYGIPYDGCFQITQPKLYRFYATYLGIVEFISGKKTKEIN